MEIIEEMAQSDLELEGFITSIKPKYERISCKFLVHVSSQFDVEGHMAGSRITAWVDRNFHTFLSKFFPPHFILRISTALH